MPKETAENLKKERELVIARLEVMSPELYFSSGHSFQNFSRDEIIAQIKQGTEVGAEFVRTEMEFLRALKGGQLLKSLIAEQT
jgi:hypothetical protein